MEKQDQQTWTIWFSVFLIVIGITLFVDAGPAAIRGSEVGSGFLPKVADVCLILFAILTFFTALNAHKPIYLVPVGVGKVLVVLAIGMIGVVTFQMLGMIVALVFLFYSVFSLFERKLGLVNLLVAVAVAYAVHGFFVGFLGIWDPAGQLVDLRWLAPW